MIDIWITERAFILLVFDYQYITFPSHIHSPHNTSSPNQCNNCEMFIQQDSRSYQSEQRIEINIVGSAYRSQIFSTTFQTAKQIREATTPRNNKFNRTEG